jgi:hypothetical protein
MKILNQAVAVKKGVSSRVNESLTEHHKVLSKPALFSGFIKTYKPIDESGEALPPDSQKVQFKVEEILKDMSKNLTELMDIEATIDRSNSSAKADVEVDGNVLLSDVPSTTLLFLEKELTRFKSDLQKLPELDPAEQWDFDAKDNTFKTPVTATQRTKKTQKAIVLYDATDKHPAQTQLITEDVLAGHWNQVKSSGAVTNTRKKELVDRTSKLIDAVKIAREKANSSETVETKVGEKIFDFILK